VRCVAVIVEAARVGDIGPFPDALRKDRRRASVIPIERDASLHASRARVNRTSATVAGINHVAPARIRA
jgi:hypothetical protein